MDEGGQYRPSIGLGRWLSLIRGEVERCSRDGITKLEGFFDDFQNKNEDTVQSVATGVDSFCCSTNGALIRSVTPEWDRITGTL